MAFKIGSTTVVDDSAAVYDGGNRILRKINNVLPNANGDIAVTTMAGDPGVNVATGTPSTYFYRTVITKGFMLGGYKDSSPWKNVNRVVMATDVTTNLGDQLTRGGSYISGGFDEVGNMAGAFATADAYAGSSSATSLFNMTTEAGIADSAGYNMHVSRDSCGSMQHLVNRYTYVVGGGSDSTSKIMWATGTNTSTTAPGSAGNHTGSIWGETNGQVTITNSKYHFTYSSETWAGWGTPSGIDGCQKGLSTKLGWGYIGRDGNCGSSSGFDKYLNSTGAWLMGTMAKPRDCGEENYITGQYHGYCLGLYNNSAQSNESFKWYYLTDVGMMLGSAGQPKGHDGCSSGGGVSGV